MPELTSTARCFTTCSSVPLSCSKPILLVGSSTDCLVTCSSLVSPPPSTVYINLGLSTDEKPLQTRNFPPACRDSSWSPSSVSQLLPSTAFRFVLSWLEWSLSLLMRNPSSARSLYSASCPSWQSTGGYNTSTGRQSILIVVETFKFSLMKTADVRPVSCSA